MDIIECTKKIKKNDYKKVRKQINDDETIHIEIIDNDGNIVVENDMPVLDFECKTFDMADNEMISFGTDAIFIIASKQAYMTWRDGFEIPDILRVRIAYKDNIEATVCQFEGFKPSCINFINKQVVLYQLKAFLKRQVVYSVNDGPWQDISLIREGDYT